MYEALLGRRDWDGMVAGLCLDGDGRAAVVNAPRSTSGRRKGPMRFLVIGSGKPVAVTVFRGADQAVRVRKVLLGSVRGVAKVVEPVEPQKPFALNYGPFTYSATTVRLLKAGHRGASSAIERFLLGLASVDGSSASALDDMAACLMLTERFILLLTHLSEFMTLYNISSMDIDGKTGFAEVVDALIRDQMSVEARSFAEFSESLHRDVRLSLAERGEVRFAWGSLGLVDRTMTVVVRRDTPAPPRLGKRVVAVEPV